jgi:hypothetical protein
LDPNIEWQWEDGGQYVQFDNNLDVTFEHIYSKVNPKAVVQYHISANGFTYQLDFQTMIQTNIKLGTKRNVIRHDYSSSTTTSSLSNAGPFLSSKKAKKVTKVVTPFPKPPSVTDHQRVSTLLTTSSFPSYWQQKEIDEAKKLHGKMYELKSSEVEFIAAQTMIHHSLPRASIVRVYKVVNPVNFLHYQHWCDLLKMKLALPDLNETYTFHGTSEASIDSIVKGGFRYRFNGRHNYGRGCYFAREASYSADPTYAIPNNKGEKFIFINRLCVGQTKVGTVDLAAADETFQTAVDVMKNPSLYVAFDDHQSYCEFLVVIK